MRLLIVTVVAMLVSWINFSQTHSLHFVDAARYADVARNLFLHHEYAAHFSFPNNLIIGQHGWATNVPPLHSIVIAFFFALFGISDQSVLLESQLFFVMGALILFQLAKRVTNPTTAFFSALLYIFTLPLINYAKDGASEPLFIFELLVIIWGVYSRKPLLLFLTGIVMALTLFTKLQGYVIFPILISWMLFYRRLDLKKVATFISPAAILMTLNQLGLFLSFYRPFELPIYLTLQQTALYPSDDLPRKGEIMSVTVGSIFQNLQTIGSKFFYSIYNFQKVFLWNDTQLPSWGSPLMQTGFVLSFLSFFDKESKDLRDFRWLVVWIGLGMLILTSLTSPSVRYLHPVLPLGCILVVDFLRKVVACFVGNQINQTKVLLVIIIMYALLPYLGLKVLDSRFSTNAFNPTKPPAAKLLAEKMNQFTSEQDLIVTNLDSWGGWYGQRKNVLIPPQESDLQRIDKINRINLMYLTDFQKDNADHPLTGIWGDLFYNSPLPNNSFIQQNFNLVKVATISAQENYEKQQFTYKIWQRK